MHDVAISASQVSVAAGVTFAEAQFAVYMASVSDAWSLRDFSQKTGLSIAACRDAAFRWGIQFCDYDPFGAQQRLEWRKAEKGWALFLGPEEIGECRRQSGGKYLARLFSQTASENWDARRAMTDLSREVDALSGDLPGFTDAPVKALLCTKEGLVEEVLFGDGDAPEVSACRDALDYRASIRRAA
jgi:hypothetical protein